MRLFHNTEPGHNKFWEISSPKVDEFKVDGLWTIRVRWGRIGTAGQTQIKAFRTHYGASDFLEKKISEKIGNGYHEVATIAPAEDAPEIDAPSANQSEVVPPKKADLDDLEFLDVLGF